MKLHKFISVLLHPIVIPTIGVLLFLWISPNYIEPKRQYLLLSIVFFATYIIPLISLIILKAIGYVNSFQTESIKERKAPISIMLVIFFILGKFLYNISDFKELGLLFFGTILALIVVYILFFLKIKTSLHILSMSNALGFFIIYGAIQNINTTLLIIVFVLLTGLLASSRLTLKAHNRQEVYIGFFLGLLCQFTAFYFL